MKSISKYSKSVGRRALRPLGRENGFSRTMDLTSQTLLIDCFCNFIEVFPLIFIILGVILNALWSMKECRHFFKNGACQEVWKNQAAVLGFLKPHLLDLQSVLMFLFRSRLWPCCKDVRMAKVWQ